MRFAKLLVSMAGIALAQAQPKLPLIAVMPLSPQGVDAASALVVTDALSDQLVRDGKVRVMERSQMEKILNEQGFQQSGICDGGECALTVGRLLSIDRMVVGSLGKLGESFTLSVRVVDVSTGEVLGSARRMRKGAIDDVIADLLPLVTKDLAFQKQPKGAVADATGTKPNSSSPGPSPVAASGSKSHAWAWWTVGGVAVAGGTVAALLLTSKSSSSTSTPVPSSVALDASWKN